MTRGNRLGDTISANVTHCLSFRRIAALASIAVLSACSSQPIVKVQYVNVPTYIPAPTTLTAPTQVILGDSPTWGSALGAYKAGVDSCNADKAAISSLKSPPDAPKPVPPTP